MDGSEEDFGSLRKWLGEDHGLRGAVRVESAPVGDTELGSLPEVVSVSLGAGGAGTVLASALITWLQSRRTTAKVTVEADGRSVVLEIETLEDVRPLLEQILRPGGND